MNLHHDAVAGQKDAVGRRQGESVGEWLVGFDRLRVGEALALSAAEDVHGDGELVAAQAGLTGDFIRADVDQLDLVKPMTGRRIALDGLLPSCAFFVDFLFDRGLCFRGFDAFWTLAYDNRGTKAVLYKNWKEHRELNRSYYFAKEFDCGTR